MNEEERPATLERAAYDYRERINEIAYDIRCDWSDFDGRELVELVDKAAEQSGLNELLPFGFIRQPPRPPMCPWCKQRHPLRECLG